MNATVLRSAFRKVVVTDSTENLHRITFFPEGWKTSGPEVPPIKLFVDGKRVRIEQAMLFRDTASEVSDIKAARNLSEALAASARNAERLLKKMIARQRS